jgi:hypothetical protein
MRIEVHTTDKCAGIPQLTRQQSMGMTVTSTIASVGGGDLGRQAETRFQAPRMIKKYIVYRDLQRRWTGKEKSGRINSELSA